MGYRCCLPSHQGIKMEVVLDYEELLKLIRTRHEPLYWYRLLDAFNLNESDRMFDVNFKTICATVMWTSNNELYLSKNYDYYPDSENSFYVSVTYMGRREVK